MLNASFIGRVYPARGTYLVGREKVREFARAVRADNPVSLDVEAARAAGYQDLVAPVTFPIALAMEAAEVVIMDPELGLDYSAVVHGEQGFSFARPLVAGDELEIVVTIENIRSAAGNDMITVRADAATLDGERVVTATMLLVARGTAA
ncbi:MAG: MaoC family dehydratase N-terminal domain-containing protein [Candidatus Nanopelagicales bacterium]|nr:MaoC family dehydratase N-terminal domain-containing protein [Candidatus Nanopelagicales bacterium]